MQLLLFLLWLASYSANNFFCTFSGDAGIINLGPSENSTLRGTSSAMDVDVIVSRPFAMVDEITEASPAAEDGLQLGDRVVKFGNVEFGEDLLQRLAAEAQKNQGCAISMVVLRHGALINLTVTPREWQGRGLLGYAKYIFHFLFSDQFLYFLKLTRTLFTIASSIVTIIVIVLSFYSSMYAFCFYFFVDDSFFPVSFCPMSYLLQKSF